MEMIKSLEELKESGFEPVPRRFPKSYYKEEKDEAIIFEYLGFQDYKEMYRKVYHGKSKYVKAIID